YKFVRNKDLDGIITVVINPAFYIYAIIGFALGFIFLRYETSFTDEFSHWALVSKNMFLHDNFGNVGDVTTMFNQYVPATGIFMYAFQIFGSEFSNGALYSAFNLLLLSLLLPIIERFDKKVTWVAILFTVLTLALPVAFKASVYMTLMVDPLLAILCAYIYLSYSLDKGRSDGFTIINISLACLVITLTKSSGLAFGIFGIIFIFIDALTRGREGLKTFFSNKINFALVLLPVVLIAFAKLSWSWYVDFYNVRAGWETGEMTLANILEWIKNANPYQSAVTARFFKNFFVGSIKYDGGLQLPQILVLAVIAGINVLFGFRTKNKAFAITQGVVMYVMVIGYGLVLLLMYLFSFSYREGLALASYPRYNISMMLSIVLVFLYQFAELYGVGWSEKDHGCNNRETRKRLVKLTHAKFVSVAAVLAVAFIIGGLVYDQSKLTSPYDVWRETLATLNPSEDSVYIVVTDEDVEAQSQVYIRMRFYATPLQASGYLEGGSYAEGRDAQVCWTGNPFSMKLSVDELAQEMSSYTHVYLHDVWAEFEDKYGELFASPIEDDTLYEITYDGGNLKLVKAQ
ncbi:MAG: hypothetical protein NC179_05600, partial [[Eubacterium] siraeum]|nr:hypothetical protein [[Eubacterium] siraeum]